MAAVGRADNRAASRHDPGRALPIEEHEISGRKQALEAVEKSKHFPTELFRREDDAAKDRVQARTIAAAGQDTDAGLRHAQR